jgi:hypothetical protein
MMGSLPVARRSSRSKPVDGPGDDVGERLHAVHVTLVITGMRAPGRMRRRGDLLYPREYVPVWYRQEMAFTAEAFEPGGEDALALGIGRRFLRAVREEGWPPAPNSRRWRPGKGPPDA